ASAAKVRGKFNHDASVHRAVNSQGQAAREAIHTRAVSWTMLAIFVLGSSAFLVLILALEQTSTMRALLGRSDIPQNAFFFATQLLLVVGGLLFGVARLRP